MKPEHEYWYPVHNAKGADLSLETTDEEVERRTAQMLTPYPDPVAAVQLVMEAAGMLAVELDEAAALAVVEVWRSGH